MTSAPSPVPDPEALPALALDGFPRRVGPSRSSNSVSPVSVSAAPALCGHGRRYDPETGRHSWSINSGEGSGHCDSPPVATPAAPPVPEPAPEDAQAALIAELRLLAVHANEKRRVETERIATAAADALAADGEQVAALRASAQILKNEIALGEHGWRTERARAERAEAEVAALQAERDRYKAAWAGGDRGWAEEQQRLRRCRQRLADLRARVAQQDTALAKVRDVREDLMGTMHKAREAGDQKMHLILWAINDNLRAALGDTTEGTSHD